MRAVRRRYDAYLRVQDLGASGRRRRDARQATCECLEEAVRHPFANGWQSKDVGSPVLTAWIRSDAAERDGSVEFQLSDLTPEGGFRIAGSIAASADEKELRGAQRLTQVRERGDQLVDRLSLLEVTDVHDRQ